MGLVCAECEDSQTLRYCGWWRNVQNVRGKTGVEILILHSNLNIYALNQKIEISEKAAELKILIPLPSQTCRSFPFSSKFQPFHCKHYATFQRRLGVSLGISEQCLMEISSPPTRTITRVVDI